MAARVLGGVPVSVSHEAPLQGRSRHPLWGLLAAAHLGPALAVTVMATAYAAALDLTPGQVALVGAAVLAGQLSIGWSNDLVDLRRDREVARKDKPLATGVVSVRMVRTACAAAVVLAVVLSLACGLVAGAVHVGLVAAGWAYNLGLKATVLSWLPYAVAFGGLPVFVHLAGDVDLPAATVAGGHGAARRRRAPAQRPARPRRRRRPPASSDCRTGWAVTGRRGSRSRRSPPPR